MSAIQIVALAARHYPLAERAAARRQAIRLIRAKRYLRSRNIDASQPGNDFKYVPATGSILK